ncbi:MAG: MoaD/ThiS family protein [Acidobacteriota bacterium]|jgi:MoaD family protein|nr:MoaD/ThiS family protein [Acidobacteriota bacterium]
MRITVHTILGLRRALGQKQTEIDLPEGATLDDLFSYMKEKWGEPLAAQLFDPETGKVLPQLQILVNGQAIHSLAGIKTLLKEGDEVRLLPLISGG